MEAIPIFAILNKKIKGLASGTKSITYNSTSMSIDFEMIDGTVIPVPLPYPLTQTEIDMIHRMTIDADGDLCIDGIKIGGSGSIEEDIISGVNCGAIVVNQKFLKGTSNTDMWKKLLIRELAPLVTITSDIDATLVYEKGVTISPTLIVTAKKVNTSDNDIKKVTLQATPTDVNYDYVDNTPNPNTNTYTKNIIISNTSSYKASAVNDKNLTGSRTLTFTFVNPIYIGAVDESLDENTVTESDIKLNSAKKILNIKATNNKHTESLTAVGKKVVIAYDKTIGTLNSVIDVQNGFENITAMTKFERDFTMADGTVVTYECFINGVRQNVTNKDAEFTWV